MAQRSILEYRAKGLLFRHWKQFFEDEFTFEFQSISVESAGQVDEFVQSTNWLNRSRLVVKPDMLFGERGKNGLVFITKSTGEAAIKEIKNWISDQQTGEKTLISGGTGYLTRFLIEPFVVHTPEEEFYISFSTDHHADTLYLSAQGGVEIMQNWDKVKQINIPLDIAQDEIAPLIQSEIPDEMPNKAQVAAFANRLYSFFKALHFTDFELNPFVLRGNQVWILDTVAKLDDTAQFLMQDAWGDMQFPTPFGTAELTEEEQFIKRLDENTGASLKLTILKPEARVWTLVAGGGASVVYADTISETWGVDALANYGEYSGNPSQSETYQYAKTIIDLMTREKDKDGRHKVLLIGGAIANFTDVAKTFEGIIQAFQETADKMKEVGVRIYVRRGGPNYETGLKNIRRAAKNLGLPIEVYGPETHLTEIVRIALDDDKTEAKETANVSAV